MNPLRPVIRIIRRHQRLGGENELLSHASGVQEIEVAIAERLQKDPRSSLLADLRPHQALLPPSVFEPWKEDEQAGLSQLLRAKFSRNMRAEFEAPAIQASLADLTHFRDRSDAIRFKALQAGEPLGKMLRKYISYAIRAGLVVVPGLQEVFPADVAPQLEAFTRQQIQFYMMADGIW